MWRALRRSLRVEWNEARWRRKPNLYWLQQQRQSTMWTTPMLMIIRSSCIHICLTYLNNCAWNFRLETVCRIVIDCVGTQVKGIAHAAIQTTCKTTTNGTFPNILIWTLPPEWFSHRLEWKWKISKQFKAWKKNERQKYPSDGLESRIHGRIQYAYAVCTLWFCLDSASMPCYSKFRIVRIRFGLSWSS